MKRLFAAQRRASVFYIAVTLVVLVYALAFMTQYSDLVGLRLEQNRQIANFYTVGLQTFNRHIFAWALLAVAGIVLVFFLELRTRVPDRFALVVMTVCLAGCCYGAYFAVTNLLSLQAYYGRLDFQYLALEGGAADYRPKFATFRVGLAVYAAQIAVCVSYAVILIASHRRYKKLEREGRKDGT